MSKRVAVPEGKALFFRRPDSLPTEAGPALREAEAPAEKGQTRQSAIFLELGRRLGPRVRDLLGIFPAYLLPWFGLGLAVLLIGYLAYEHGFLPKAGRGAVEPR